MRSTLGVTAAVAGLLTYPTAIAAGLTIGGTASNTAVHFVLGSAYLLLAVAMADFGLARWVTLLGGAAAALFGGTFLLQGVADLTGSAPLAWLAFDVLGHEIERVLPAVVYVWFAALLLTGSRGRTRYLGWAIVPTLFGLELAIVVGSLTGINVPFIKLTILLPFVWLLFESAKRPSIRTDRSRAFRQTSMPTSATGPASST
jgi:hypothetical protein